VAYEVAAYQEFNFDHFTCAESNATTHNARCDALGVSRVGHAETALYDPLASNTGVLRLTPESVAQTGAAWWKSRVHVENGFETSFRFRISSSCVTGSTSTECGTGDGFAFVLYGGDSLTTAVGCGGRALGFASDAANNCTSGIPYSFAVEFDTWHNPELQDINTRGAGTSDMNATKVTRYSFAHAAFFSEGASPNTVMHSKQIAGTPAIPEIADGTVHQVRFVYIPGSTSAAIGRVFLYIDDMQSFVLTAPIRFARQGTYCDVDSRTDRCILDAFGNVYMGFTSATGGVAQMHDIHAWSFCDQPNCERHYT
jgi:hypothetical protein